MMDDEKKIPSSEVEAIAADVLRPGTEMSRVYRGLFEALAVIERRLDAIEQQQATAAPRRLRVGDQLFKERDE